MPIQNGSHKDEAFGAKIAHLQGILGHQFSQAHFVQKRLAEVIATPLEIKPHESPPEPDESAFSKKCIGNRSVTYAELARIVDHFGLAPVFDYELFLEHLPTFKERLKQAKIGTHAGCSDALAMCELLALARRETKTGPSKLDLQIVSENARRGGIGGERGEPVQSFKSGGAFAWI